MDGNRNPSNIYKIKWFELYIRRIRFLDTMPSTTDAVLPLFQAPANVDTSGSDSSDSSESEDEAAQPPAKGLGKGLMVAANENGVASRAKADSTEAGDVEAGVTDADSKNNKGGGVKSDDSKAVPAKSGVKGTSAKAAVNEPASVKGGGKGGGGKADKADSANASASKTNKSISTKATGLKGGGNEDNKTGVNGLLEVFYPGGNSTAKEGDAPANSTEEGIDKKGDEGECDEEDDEEDDEDEDEDDDDDEDEQNDQEMKITEAKRQLSLDNVDKVVGTNKKTRGKGAAAQEHAVAESGKGKYSANKTLPKGAVRGPMTTSTAGVHGKSQI